jgi:nucleoid-associated protein YgaU
MVLHSAEAAVQKQGNPPTDYLVKDGDALFDIAQAYYGDGNLYTKIQDANLGLTPQTL